MTDEELAKLAERVEMLDLLRMDLQAEVTHLRGHLRTLYRHIERLDDKIAIHEQEAHGAQAQATN